MTNKASALLAVAAAVVAAVVARPVVASPPDDPVDYIDASNWVCRPDIDDVCDSGLDATAVAADGTLTAVPFVAAADAPIDCFYVYPTVSTDEGANSDLVAGDEERFVVQNQAAPLGSGCRVFAPVYRQVTLTALTRALSGSGSIGPEAGEIAYADVVEAWQSYLDHDNDGRGVILVGHSQGAGILTRLIEAEIDPDADRRDLLVAAYLAGTSVQVPLNEDVGGVFQNVPLCRAEEQFGCVVTWSSYRSTSPPPDNAFFGRGGEATEAGCTNPAALAGGEAELAVRFGATISSSILTDPDGAATGTPWIDPAFATVDTPFVELPGLVRGACVSWDGANWLEVRVNADPADPRADDIGGDLTPEWGLHIVDVSLVMGDLQRLVQTQGAAWVAAH